MSTQKEKYLTKKLRLFSSLFNTYIYSLTFSSYQTGEINRKLREENRKLKNLNRKLKYENEELLIKFDGVNINSLNDDYIGGIRKYKEE
jgi:hypothetical protein